MEIPEVVSIDGRTAARKKKGRRVVCDVLKSEDAANFSRKS